MRDNSAECTVDTVAVDCPDDGDYCNGAPTCEAGACVAAVPVVCDAGQECDEDANECVAAPEWALTPVLDTGDPAERECNPRSYTDLENGIVRDDTTGLEWVQDGNLIATLNPSFDNDGTAGDGAVTWQHALDYIVLLNEQEYLGYSDWRLPTIEELSTLVDAGRSAPAIDPLFSDTEEADYWSSTPYAANTGFALSPNFAEGIIYRRDKTILLLCARCARVTVWAIW